MSPEDVLSSRLQGDKTWRIRELSELVRACADATFVRREALLRASVPLLYAHWEGYFVLAANNYLAFVTEKRINLASLKDEFWAISIKKRYKPNQINSEKSFTRFLMDIRKDKSASFKKGSFDRINGQSNLKSDVLEYCCGSIGLNVSPFEAYFEFIDNQLINKRNFIAHGESLRFGEGDVASYRDKVVDLMRITHSEIENLAVTGAYLR